MGLSIETRYPELGRDKLEGDSQTQLHQDPNSHQITQTIMHWIIRIVLAKLKCKMCVIAMKETSHFDANQKKELEIKRNGEMK